MDLTGWLDYFVAGLSTQLQEVKAGEEQAIRARHRVCGIPQSARSPQAREDSEREAGIRDQTKLQNDVPHIG